MPEGVPVSATNEAGSHLSARRRIHLFPKLKDAQYVLYADSDRSRAMARDRPTLRPLGTRPKLRQLTGSREDEVRHRKEDVRLWRSVPRSRS